MTSLHKFKLLATQCAVAGSPTPSPTTSPVVSLRRRRKTLRMFLSRSSTDVCRRLPPCDESTDRRVNSPEKRREMIGVSHKLKDLFMSSPPLMEQKEICQGLSAVTARAAGNQSDCRHVGHRSIRPLSAAFRQRLLRRAWRPVLVTITE